MGDKLRAPLRNPSRIKEIRYTEGFKVPPNRAAYMPRGSEPLIQPRSKKTVFLSHLMEYDRGESFPFDFEPNGIPFGSENRKENCHHDYIPLNAKGKGNIVFSVYAAVHNQACLHCCNILHVT